MIPLRILSLLAAALVVAPPACRASARVVRQTFPARAGDTLRIDTYRGGIEVRESPDASIHVTVNEQPPTDDPEEAGRCLQRLHLDMKAEGGTVSVVARNPSETRLRFIWDDGQRINLDYTVLIPPACNLDLATNNGSVSVDRHKGRVVAYANKGTVFLRYVEGDVRASTDTGDIVVSRCLGSADLRTRRGSIRAGTIAGRATLHTLNGDIELQHAPGGLAASAEAGDVTVGLDRGFSQGVRIRTNGGEIVVRLDPAARCSISASSVWGWVHSALPIAVRSGGDGRRTLDGVLNGGGPLVDLHADGGQVRINPAPQPDPRPFAAPAGGR